mgnify:CR=1 FL=1
MIEITDKALQTAAAKGMDEFLRVFTDKYKETVGGDPTAETMPLLSGEQHSLLAYRIFRDEVTEGGFCQLIQNGYGAYIFGNPFARVMRLWGAESFSKLVYRAKKIYDANREDLERERTDEEFMAMYEQYEASTSWRRSTAKWKPRSRRRSPATWTGIWICSPRSSDNRPGILRKQPLRIAVPGI